MRTAEEREATRRRRELWIQKIEEEDRKEAEANAFDSPPPVGGRPKTSRGSRNPDPEKVSTNELRSDELRRRVLVHRQSARAFFPFVAF